MTTEERFERMEKVIDHMVDRQEQLDAALTTLADAHIKSQEQYQETQRQYQATQRQIARVAQDSLARDKTIEKRLERLAKESAGREKRVDGRIEKLVIAMGEFISRDSNGAPKPKRSGGPK